MQVSLLPQPKEVDSVYVIKTRLLNEEIQSAYSPSSEPTGWGWLVHASFKKRGITDSLSSNLRLLPTRLTRPRPPGSPLTNRANIYHFHFGTAAAVLSVSSFVLLLISLSLSFGAGGSNHPRHFDSSNAAKSSQFLVGQLTAEL